MANKINGSIRKRGNTWSYRIDLGKDSTGKRIQKEKGGFKSEKEANDAMILAKAEFLSIGEIKENKHITVGEIFNEFIDQVAPITRKHATIVRYKSLYKNHISHFANRIIGEIDSCELQSFLTERVTKFGLSSDYTRSIYNFLLVLWCYAEEKKYIKSNNIHRVKPPKEYRSTGDIKIYTMDEIKKIWDRIKNTNNATAFMLGFKLGLRAGEIYALRWSDIDFKNNTVDICKQLQKQDKKWCLTTLKTHNSYRKIKFDNSLKSYLLELKHTQEDNKKFFEEYYKTNRVVDKSSKKESIIDIDDFVNVKNDGEMLTTDSSKIISRICKSDLGIEFKMHNLRHTHATMLLEKGINPKYVSERLGHSKLEFTLKLYTHVTRAQDEQAIDALNFSL